MSETMWYVCSWCEARQSKHEKFPRCAYCEGGLLSPEKPQPSADATAGERERIRRVLDSIDETDAQRNALPVVYRVSPQFIADVRSLLAAPCGECARLREVLEQIVGITEHIVTRTEGRTPVTAMEHIDGLARASRTAPEDA